MQYPARPFEPLVPAPLVTGTPYVPQETPGHHHEDAHGGQRHAGHGKCTGVSVSLDGRHHRPGLGGRPCDGTQSEHPGSNNQGGADTAARQIVDAKSGQHDDGKLPRSLGVPVKGDRVEPRQVVEQVADRRHSEGLAHREKHPDGERHSQPPPPSTEEPHESAHDERRIQISAPTPPHDRQQGCVRPGVESEDGPETVGKHGLGQVLHEKGAIGEGTRVGPDVGMGEVIKEGNEGRRVLRRSPTAPPRANLASMAPRRSRIEKSRTSAQSTTKRPSR